MAVTLHNVWAAAILDPLYTPQCFQWQKVLNPVFIVTWLTGQQANGSICQNARGKIQKVGWWGAEYIKTLCSLLSVSLLSTSTSGSKSFKNYNVFKQ